MRFHLFHIKDKNGFVRAGNSICLQTLNENVKKRQNLRRFYKKFDSMVDVFLIAHATRKVLTFAELNEYNAKKMMSAWFIECIKLYFCEAMAVCTQSTTSRLMNIWTMTYSKNSGLFKSTATTRQKLKKPYRLHNIEHIQHKYFVSLVNHLQWNSANNQNFLWMILSTRLMFGHKEVHCHYEHTNFNCNH